MRKEIIISASSSQTRVAITEEGNLVDFFVENPEKRRMVGDIYLGRIARVLPGIRAAFIDIGLKHDAFLHFSDIGDRLEALQTVLEDDDDDAEIEVDDDEILENEKTGRPKSNSHGRQNREIPKLHKGQDILIQIIKEPVKDKGVRVSTSLSLPGRFCVMLPMDTKIGVSKKISDYRERKRLRRIAREILPKNCGLIIRTAAKDQDEKALAADLKYLVKTWKDLEEAAKTNKPPSLIHRDLSTTRSVIRDLFTDEVENIFVDSKKLYKEIRDYVHFMQPELIEKINYFKEEQPIFETFKVEEQIKQLMGRKVSLPAGGHIVIEHTEAMTVIDVNSGRYAAKKDQELNSLKTDLEASREIVRQLRLRDIGGLIVVDFIDLEEEKNRKKIYDELRKEFKKDRAKIAMLPMTDFGLMQITRQRVRENILQSVNEVCPYCLGTGLLTKKSYLIHEIEDWLKKYKLQGKERKLTLKVHPSLASELNDGLFSKIFKLRTKYFLKINLEEDPKMNPQHFHFISTKTGTDLTEEFS